MKFFKDKKNIILLVLILAVLIMGYGYGVLLQQLIVEGNAEIHNATWQVEITDIKDKSVFGSASVIQKPTFTKYTATLNSAFHNKGDGIIYELTVENKGSIDAILQDVNIVVPSGMNNLVTYKVLNVTPGATRLPAGSTNTIGIEVTYNNETQILEQINERVEIIINYVQDTK